MKDENALPWEQRHNPTHVSIWEMRANNIRIEQIAEYTGMDIDDVKAILETAPMWYKHRYNRSCVIDQYASMF